MVKRGDLREILAVTLGGVFLGVILPTMSLFVFGGAESQANMIKFFFYGIMLFSSILAIDMVRLLRSEGFFDSHPEYAGFGRMTVHSPTETLMYQRLKDVKPVGSFVAETVKRPSRFFLVSLILSVGMGLYMTFRATFISGTPKLVEGQVTESAQLSLAVEPAVISESLFFFVVMFFLQAGTIEYVLRERFGMSEFYARIVAKLLAVPLVIIEFMAYHLFRYGTAETSLVGVGLLGAISAVSMAVFNSVIFLYMIHASGNFFNKLTELGLFTSEFITVAAVVLLILFVIVYVLVFDPFDMLRNRKK